MSNMQTRDAALLSALGATVVGVVFAVMDLARGQGSRAALLLPAAGAGAIVWVLVLTA